MEIAELEVQLNVWKELAISKQVLMLSATKALGLEEDCSAEELEKALNETIAKGKNAAADIKAAEEKTAAQISTMEDKVKSIKCAIDEAVEVKEKAEAQTLASEQKLAAVREASAMEVSKATAQMNDAQKEMKRIQKLLADTPENIVKKLKQLKKEKMDEANARKKAEELNRNLRKEKQKADDAAEQAKASLEKAAELAASYRELQALANDQYTKLAGLVEDKAELEKVPAFDADVLDALEGVEPRANDKAA